MIELILVRHAKSDWDDPRIADHDRPLNARGRRDAPVMAERLAQAGADVQRIVSSTALRARTTAAAFGSALGVEVELDEELYLASEETLLAKAVATGAPSVMLVAHNPGISDLAFRLSHGGIGHMPTCAVARFIWDLDSWGAVNTAEPGISFDSTPRPADSWSLDTPR